MLAHVTHNTDVTCHEEQEKEEIVAVAIITMIYADIHHDIC